MVPPVRALARIPVARGAGKGSPLTDATMFSGMTEKFRTLLVETDTLQNEA
jgi:hypothetical protein